MNHSESIKTITSEPLKGANVHFDSFLVSHFFEEWTIPNLLKQLLLMAIVQYCLSLFSEVRIFYQYRNEVYTELVKVSSTATSSKELSS
jgi:hypothetical protein